jgi:ribA/ribD-fused uncharacterized protein
MNKNLRTYNANEVISFRKTSETFGGLSNMSPGYSINVNGVIISTAEHLYQACRFPDFPEIQEAIILENNPMKAKKISRLNASLTRHDWEQVRIGIMRWCLQIKLSQNWNKFSELLNQTGDKAIVEFTYEDKLWGATLEGDKYIGVNALGRLLMELREKHTKHQNRIYCVDPLPIEKFNLFNDKIEQICDELNYEEYSQNFDYKIELI